MKNILLLIFIMTTGLALTSQVNMSCNSRMDCIWDNNTQQYDGCDEYMNNSLFVLSENSAMITHTISDNQTTYYLKGSTLVEEEGALTVDAVSDTGREYKFIFDTPNNYIFILFQNTDGKVYMVRFTVKSTW
jgi:hypothetical protein